MVQSLLRLGRRRRSACRTQKLAQALADDENFIGLNCGRDQFKTPAFLGFFCFLGSFFWIAFANRGDRKSTRLNSSHQIISYAVFCLKKKKTYIQISVLTT